MPPVCFRHGDTTAGIPGVCIRSLEAEGASQLSRLTVISSVWQQVLVTDSMLCKMILHQINALSKLISYIFILQFTPMMTSCWY